MLQKAHSPVVLTLEPVDIRLTGLSSIKLLVGYNMFKISTGMFKIRGAGVSGVNAIISDYITMKLQFHKSINI